MKKRLLAVLLVLAMILSCTACGSSEEPKTEEPVATEAPAEDTPAAETPAEPSAEAFGDTIKYDPTVPVNNGEPITLDYWLWTSDDLWGGIMQKYMDIHPNVTINIVNNPYDDYWVKLPLALSGSDGPALFNMHISYHDNVINYMAPYDIPVEDLKADFQNVDAHVIDGKVYYLDTGFMTGSIFYNKDMWEAAGLTEEDIPKTWDEFWPIAQKLTVKDGDQIIQSGWACNNYINSNYLMGLNYQLGQNLFEADMKTADINNEAQQKVMQMLVDAVNDYGVTTVDFTDEALVSFATGQTAMISSWGWLNDYMHANFPDINFGVFEIPVFDPVNLYAYNRMNTESTMGINKNADPAQQAVAQDIIKFLLADDESLLNIAVATSVLPSKTSLGDSDIVMQNDALRAVKEHIDQYVFPGPLPSIFETYLAEAGENVFYNGMAIDEALQIAEDKINADLANMEFTSIEDQYVPKN